MQLGSVLKNISLTVAVLAGVVTFAGLAHALFGSHGPDMLVHELETWMTTVAFYFVLILLATVGIEYLASKK
jgi:uncharacterized membrane protein